MKNRKQIPQTFRQKCFRLKDGDVQAYQSGRFLALAWRAPSKNKGIIMLTSKDSANVISEEAEKPVVVVSYNQSMNGVDLAD